MTDKNFLFLSDSDGTIVATFEPSPSGYGVNEAYNQALLDIFGQYALNIFLESGLKNRAPREVIEQIFPDSQSMINGRAKLVENARTFFNKDERYMLDSLVPEGKGSKLVWDESDLIPLFTELLVRVKLSYLMNNIGAKFQDGTMWPRMYPGVSYFLETLKQYGDFGIISSGHDLFIKKYFEIYNMECPKLMLTDDDLRARNIAISKPNPQLIHLALKQWKQVCGPIVIYTGDDREKDGMLAKNAGIPFILFDQNDEQHWFKLADSLQKGELFI